LAHISSCNCLWLNYLTLCESLGLSLGLGLEVQSLGLGLNQKGLVLVLENFCSLGLGLLESLIYISAKNCDEVLVWFSVWSEMQIICMCHCHAFLASLKSRLV